MGRGKGLAVYYDVSRFQVTKQIGENNYQLTKIESGTFTVIALYRSQGEVNFLDQLMENIPETGDCLMIGDLNICSKKQQQHEIFKNLRTKGFKLLIKEATHMKGGHIDQVWLRSSCLKHNISLYSPYYTCRDHDAILCTLINSTTVEEGNYFINFFIFLNQVLKVRRSLIILQQKDKLKDF